MHFRKGGRAFRALHAANKESGERGRGQMRSMPINFGGNKFKKRARVADNRKTARNVTERLRNPASILGGI